MDAQAENSIPEGLDRNDDPLLLREDRQAVAVLTLNRPETRNALSEAMLKALNETFSDISVDRQIKAVVLRANGPVFCAGHDIREMQSRRSDADGGKAFFTSTFDACAAFMQKVLACPKPVIAAVEGTATAAGCQLVATCDLAVASDEAKFCTPGVHIGLFCSTPAVAVARNIGRKRAMEMLLLGEMIDATQACEFGLVNRVVAKKNVMKTALEFAETIASKSAAANALGKKAFYQQIASPIDEAYSCASRTMVENMMLEDADEGLGAFLEKRAPKWRDA